jgi:hypothetical protein
MQAKKRLDHTRRKHESKIYSAHVARHGGGTGARFDDVHKLRHGLTLEHGEGSEFRIELGQRLDFERHQLCVGWLDVHGHRDGHDELGHDGRDTSVGTSTEENPETGRAATMENEDQSQKKSKTSSDIDSSDSSTGTESDSGGE